jgi:atypical dual specificity phosphatase
VPLTWFEPGKLCGSPYPDGAALHEAAAAGVTTVINLDEQPHTAAALSRAGLTQVHLPVVDFSAPGAAQLDAGVAAIEQAIADGGAALVHCRYGVGRTGTLVACWYVSQGLDPRDAIARVRELRPGSVETPGQAEAVAAFAKARLV